MKILITAKTGSVGKSFLAQHVFGPAVGDVICIESLNHTEAGIEKYTSGNFDDIFASLVTRESVVFDLGASEYVNFFAEAEKLGGVLEDFDKFIIPTKDTQKEKKDCISTIEDLLKFGVPKNKIHVVFSRVPDKCDIGKVFADLINGCEKLGIRWSENWVIYEDPFLKRVSENQIDLKESGGKVEVLQNSINKGMEEIIKLPDGSEKEEVRKKVKGEAMLLASARRAKGFSDKFGKIVEEIV